MPYCTEQELIDEFDHADLVMLTKKAGVPPNTINVARLTRAIQKGDSDINTYLTGRYTLPLPQVPAILRDIAMDFAFYYLHTRIAADHPAAIKYKNRSDTLRAVAAGKQSLGLAVDDVHEVDASADTVQVSPGRNVFSGAW